MTITPEQFNKLVTKDEHQKLEKKVNEIDKNVKKILNSVDGIADNYKTVKAEQTANLGAHKRMQKDINEVRGHVGLKIKNATL